MAENTGLREQNAELVEALEAVCSDENKSMRYFAIQRGRELLLDRVSINKDPGVDSSQDAG